MEFVDSGHDLIVAADSNASDFIRNIAAESGVDFDEVRTVYVISFFCFETLKIKFSVCSLA